MKSTGLNTKNVSKFKVVCSPSGLEEKLDFWLEVSLWPYAASDITIATLHVGYKQEGRERVERRRRDARPTKLPFLEIAIKLEPGMFQKLN